MTRPIIVIFLGVITASFTFQPTPVFNGLRQGRSVGLPSIGLKSIPIIGSWFEKGGHTKDDLPVGPNLSSYPIWRVHKYNGIAIKPVPPSQFQHVLNKFPQDGKGQDFSPQAPSVINFAPPSYGSNELSQQYGTPAETYGPPAETYGPPQPTYGPPAHEYGPPAETYGPPHATYGPPAHEYGPPAETYGPPHPTYGPPAHEYGPPAETYGPPAHEYGPPPQNYGPPAQEYGPPAEPYGYPHQTYGPPVEEYGSPPQAYDFIETYEAPAQQYGPPSQTYGTPIHSHANPPVGPYPPPTNTYGITAPEFSNPSDFLTEIKASGGPGTEGDTAAALDALASFGGLLPENSNNNVLSSFQKLANSIAPETMQKLQSIISTPEGREKISALLGLATNANKLKTNTIKSVRNYFGSLMGGSDSYTESGTYTNIPKTYPQNKGFLSKLPFIGSSGLSSKIPLPKLPELPPVPQIPGLAEIPDAPSLPYINLPQFPKGHVISGTPYVSVKTPNPSQHFTSDTASHSTADFQPIHVPDGPYPAETPDAPSEFNTYRSTVDSYGVPVGSEQTFIGGQSYDAPNREFHFVSSTFVPSDPYGGPGSYASSSENKPIVERAPNKHVNHKKEGKDDTGYAKVSLQPEGQHKEYGQEIELRENVDEDSLSVVRSSPRSVSKNKNEELNEKKTEKNSS